MFASANRRPSFRPCAAPARPRTRLILCAATPPELNVQLRCGKDTEVLVNSRVIFAASRCPDTRQAFYALQHADSSDGPLVLSVAEDSSVAWAAAWQVLSDPLADKRVLTWENITSVIELAHKYKLVPVLQACETFLLVELQADLANVDRSSYFPLGYLKPNGPFGSRFELKFQFLELLWRAGLRSAFTCMLPLYFEDLPHASECTHTDNGANGSARVDKKQLLRGALDRYCDVSQDQQACVHVLQGVLNEYLLTFA